MLNTACVERKQARKLRDEIQQEQRDADPGVVVRPKRRRRGEANALNT